MINKMGFSLLELTVVLSIIALSGFGFANFVGFQEQKKLDKAVDETVQLLQHAHTLATSNAIPVGCSDELSDVSGYIVSYDDIEKKVIISGDCAGAAEIMNPVVDFNSMYDRYVVSIPDSIVFTRYSGLVAASRTVTITSPSGKEKTIEITENGEIKRN